ncbi:transcription factor TFIIF complex subunit Tfg3 [Dimargaris cristalligena]|uniref:Protein AF-9 homolog n=1 Tax=Dimargaris cristalligena TaxID=215637 RepID=A0A4Q0A2F4_9FUNG|nr:transcription factor TFIIF complex subunit Tfg3 [Dimargaris cristalligena]RKP39522.1 yeats family-domain-containing protein [Dimargaris cristalligena]|eukprot:RKP39522.1 yeats family-domain-containing protein [Dimargaris cristalligena]
MNVVHRKITVVTTHELPKNPVKVEGIPIRNWSVLLAERDPLTNTLRYDLPFIKAVEFELHPTFPNPVTTIRQAPFQLLESGWGEFDMRIHIYYYDPEVPSATFQHDLNFRRKRYETNVDLEIIEPNPEMVRRLDPHYPAQDIQPLKCPATSGKAKRKEKEKDKDKDKKKARSAYGSAPSQTASPSVTAPTPAESVGHGRSREDQYETDHHYSPYGSIPLPETTSTPASTVSNGGIPHAMNSLNQGGAVPFPSGSSTAIPSTASANANYRSGPGNQFGGIPDAVEYSPAENGIDPAGRYPSYPHTYPISNESSSPLSSVGSHLTPATHVNPPGQTRRGPVDLGTHDTSGGGGYPSVATSNYYPTIAGNRPVNGHIGDADTRRVTEMISTTDELWIRMKALADRLYTLPPSGVLEVVETVKAQRLPYTYINESVADEFHFDLFTLPTPLIDQLWAVIDTYEAAGQLVPATTTTNTTTSSSSY